jgi:hypothetical protein
VPTRVPEAHRAVFGWVAERLDPVHFESMAAWPGQQRLRIRELGTVLFCHGTPRDENEVFTERTPESRLRPVFDPVEADVVVCGHTHMQFDRRVGSTRVVNAGSVGMSFSEPSACWALLDPDGVHLRMEVYDVERTEERLRATGFPDPPGIQIRRPPGREAMLERLEPAALGGPTAGSEEPDGAVAVQGRVQRKRPDLPRFVTIPGEALADWRLRDTTPVEVNLDGTGIGRRNLKAWGPDGDLWFFDLTAVQCEQAGVDEGDAVTVELVLATTSLPDELQDILDRDPRALARWEELSPSARRRLADHVREGRRVETRMRRARRSLLGD